MEGSVQVFVHLAGFGGKSHVCTWITVGIVAYVHR
jgi:hypothetical protein